MAKNFWPSEGTNLTAFSEDEKNEGLRALNDHDGNAQKNARFLLLDAIVSKVCLFVALGFLIWAGTRPKTVPVIVTVDAASGAAAYVGKVDRSLWGKDAIPENAKYYQMKKLIRCMYTRVIDEAAQQQYVAEASALVQGGAVSQLDSFFRADNPFAELGSRVRSVEIQQPLAQTEKTYFVNFTVTTKDTKGYALSVEDYTALVVIDFYEAAPESNPLGIYVTSFDIKKKI